MFKNNYIKSMTILELFKFNRTCNHTNVRPDADFVYCPDCGELIENQWYLVRCSCCGVKLPGIIKNGLIIPEKHFCHNCGAHDSTIERINKINFIDISYAVLLKAVVPNNSFNYTQSWVETDFKTSNYRPRLLQESL